MVEGRWASRPCIKLSRTIGSLVERAAVAEFVYDRKRVISYAYAGRESRLYGRFSRKGDFGG